jgi:hypothetical protein
MLKICAQVVTESMEEIKMLGTVLIQKDFSTQWACAKLATFLTIIRERFKVRVRRRKSKTSPLRLLMLMIIYPNE